MKDCGLRKLPMRTTEAIGSIRVLAGGLWISWALWSQSNISVWVSQVSYYENIGGRFWWCWQAESDSKDVDGKIVHFVAFLYRIRWMLAGGLWTLSASCAEFIGSWQVDLVLLTSYTGFWGCWQKDFGHRKFPAQTAPDAGRGVVDFTSFTYRMLTGAWWTS